MEKVIFLHLSKLHFTEMIAKLARLLREKRARRDPAARNERGGSRIARGKRVNFAIIKKAVPLGHFALAASLFIHSERE